MKNLQLAAIIGFLILSACLLIAAFVVNNVALLSASLFPLMVILGIVIKSETK